MNIKNKKGQSTVEYVLLVTAVVAVMIVFATNQKAGTIQNQLTTTLNTATGDITTIGDSLQGSHAGNTAPAVQQKLYSVDTTRCRQLTGNGA